MGRKAAHKRNAAAAAAAAGCAEKSGPAKKGEDGQEKHRGSTKGERGSKQKERRHQKGNSEWGAWEQLTDLGLKIRSMGSDGNCLFRSVGDQVAGDQGLHTELRKKTMDYVEVHEEDFAPFVEDDVKFADYVKMMRKDGTWAGNIELQALSMALKRNICIHRFMSPVWLIKNFDDPKVPTIHLSYHGNEHYNSVRNIDDNGPGPPSEIGISEADFLEGVGHPGVPRAVVVCPGLSGRKGMQAPASGGGPTRSGPKGGKGAKGGKDEDGANVQAVMRGTGCTDSERAAEVLKEFRGDVDSAIEFLIADMASSAAEEEQNGTLKAQNSPTENGASPSAEQSAEKAEEDEQRTSAVGPPSSGAGHVQREHQAMASLDGPDACAETRRSESRAGMTSEDGVSSALLEPASRGQGDLRVPVVAEREVPEVTPGAGARAVESRRDEGEGAGGREQGQVAPPNEDGVQAVCQEAGATGEGEEERAEEDAEDGAVEGAGEGAGEGAEEGVVDKVVVEGCAPGVGSADGGQSKEESVGGSAVHDANAHEKHAAVQTDGAGKGGESAVAGAEASQEAQASPAPPLILPCPSSGPANGRETEHSTESSKGSGNRKGGAGNGERERAIPRRQHPNKQRNGKVRSGGKVSGAGRSPSHHGSTSIAPQD